MAKELYDTFPTAKRIMDQADEVLGYKLSELIFAGPELDEKKTTRTQPAILTTSILCYESLKEEGFLPSYAAGHSLGEYSALVAAGAIDFSDAVALVAKRGRFMEEAVPSGKGGMAAIMGLDREVLSGLCLQAGGIVELVNFNSPGQIVIAGEKDSVVRAAELANEAGGKSVVLNVSGPFHSSMMKPAAEKFAAALDQIHIKSPVFPVIANVTAKAMTTAEVIKENLKQQIYQPVLWDASMDNLRSLTITHYVEVGPSKVLSRLLKKMDRKLQINHVEDSESLKQTLASLKEVN